MNLELFSAFLLITLVLFVTPGPIVTLVISTGATQGTRAALIDGRRRDARQCAAARLASPSASAGIIRYTRRDFRGAALGRRRLSGVARHPGLAACRRGERGDRAPRDHVHFRRGFMVALTNPKTIAFFTAFLPQFVDPALAGRAPSSR